jgi:DinB family protein
VADVSRFIIGEMNRVSRILASLLSAAAFSFAADSAAPPSVANIFDRDVKTAEREIVSLAEAMPADKYSFAPSTGAFEGVRTFAQQMKHVAAVNYIVAAALLEEKNPSDSNGERGPDSIQTKDDIVKFLKDSFAYVHKAIATLNDKNLTDMIKSPFGNGKTPRVSSATIPAWHAYDHYGQAVVYARMNGIIPPASR